jgi:uncharacterized lipoprotein YmbA
MNDSCFSRAVRLSAMAFLVFSLIGCAGSPSSTFYLLSPTSVVKDEAISMEQGDCIHLRIARVTLPEYLNRPHIVTRTTENNLTLSDDDQWAEPLSDTVARVLAENISQHVCTKKISLSPGKASGESDYRVEVEVYRMDGSLGKDAVLDVWWTVSKGVGNIILRSKRSKFSESVKGNTFSAFVQAQSRILDTFSREIAEAIRKGESSE